MADEIRRIGLDWGSSSMRAYLLGGDGAVVDRRLDSRGASTLRGGAPAFQATLEEVAGDWMRSFPRAELVACGMVGSQHGWREVPYVLCPANHSDVAAGCATIALEGGRSVRVVPGLLWGSGREVDVLRGEETQIFGALALRPELSAHACLVLPGTHSKWVAVQDDSVRAFATHMSGELFALLREQSVLARLMPQLRGNVQGPLQISDDAFFAGVDAASRRDGRGLANALFTVRSLGLTRKLSEEDLPDYLSGVLVGHEVQAGLLWAQGLGLDQAPLALIGEPHLCERYARAAGFFARKPDAILENTAPAGLYAFS